MFVCIINRCCNSNKNQTCNFVFLFPCNQDFCFIKPLERAEPKSVAKEREGLYSANLEPIPGGNDDEAVVSEEATSSGLYSRSANVLIAILLI